jgi:hypothetical protein
MLATAQEIFFYFTAVADSDSDLKNNFYNRTKTTFKKSKKL